jgi:hypothetical protein
MIALLVLLLAGCATTTSVVLLDPAKKYPPTEAVQVLLKPPARSYVEIAKLESKGVVGEPEPAVIEDARTRAAALGADAIIIVDAIRDYQPPVVMYEPWPPYLPWYHDRWRAYPFGFYSPPFQYVPQVHTLPGGNVYTVRSLAIKFSSP